MPWSGAAGRKAAVTRTGTDLAKKLFRTFLPKSRKQLTLRPVRKDTIETFEHRSDGRISLFARPGEHGPRKRAIPQPSHGFDRHKAREWRGLFMDRVVQRASCTLLRGDYRPGGGFGFSACHRPPRQLRGAKGALQAERGCLQADAACSGSPTPRRGGSRASEAECC